jgi:hypothetical protein
MKEPRNACRILVGEFFIKQPLICKTETDEREIGCDNGRWKKLAQDYVQWLSLVLVVLNLQVL